MKWEYDETHVVEDAVVEVSLSSLQVAVAELVEKMFVTQLEVLQ